MRRERITAYVLMLLQLFLLRLLALAFYAG